MDYLTESTEWQIKHPHIWASPGVASGIYDYIQRSIWTTNEAFANFLYYSPLATILAKLGETEEIRLSTDLLMVNPNSGFKWHQDNQNGPVLFDDALRWWVTMDDTPADYGAPVYLKGSHNNKSVKKDAVFVDLEDGDLRSLLPANSVAFVFLHLSLLSPCLSLRDPPTNWLADGLGDHTHTHTHTCREFPEQLEFRPKAGDMIVWNARTIHKIDGPENKDWGASKRRVLGGTGVVAGAKYYGEGRALFSDMATHAMKDGDPLSGPQWPRLYPTAVASEVRVRERDVASAPTQSFLPLCCCEAHKTCIGHAVTLTLALTPHPAGSHRVSLLPLHIVCMVSVYGGMLLSGAGPPARRLQPVHGGLSAHERQYAELHRGDGILGQCAQQEEGPRGGG